MTNITPDVSSLLVTVHSSAPIQQRPYSLDCLDTFLREAYRINSHITSLIRYLRQIRQPYLSTAAPPSNRIRANNKPAASTTLTTYLTDPQRAEIDTQTSAVLRELSSKISSLTAAENLRSSTESALLERQYGKGGPINSTLWQWAAGGSNKGEDLALGKSSQQLKAEGEANGIKMARESVLWYLGTRLQEAVETQRGMVEVRAAREREKEKSVLWKIGANSQLHGGHIPRRTADRDELSSDMANSSPDFKIDQTRFDPALSDNQGTTSSDKRDDELPQEMRHILESENSSLLQHYETSLSKVKAAEKSLLEIGSLQQTLVSHLSTQGEMVEQLVQDAVGTGENVQKGNRQLKRAGERWGRGLARGVFWGTVGLCGFCVVWDLVF